MRIGNFDSRRLVPCVACGEMVYLTMHWQYPSHDDPRPFEGETLPCRRQRTDSGFQELYEAAKAHESASALQDYRDKAVQTLIKMNELEIGIGQLVQKKARREH